MANSGIEWIDLTFDFLRALALPSGVDAGDQLRRNQRVVICVYPAGAAEPVVARQFLPAPEAIIPMEQRTIMH